MQNISFSALVVVVVVIVVLFWFVCLFFSVTGHLVGFISVGNVRKHSGNTLRILGLDGWKGRWVVKFSGRHCKAFCRFPCFLIWIVLFLILFERSLPSAQVRWWRCCPWLLKQKGCGSTWLGSYRWFMGQSVRQKNYARNLQSHQMRYPFLEVFQWYLQHDFQTDQLHNLMMMHKTALPLTALVICHLVHLRHLKHSTKKFNHHSHTSNGESSVDGQKGCDIEYQSYKSYKRSWIFGLFNLQKTTSIYSTSRPKHSK